MSFVGKIYSVAKQRSVGQKLVPVAMSEEFIEHLNKAVIALHYNDRSKFIREAIVEKLNNHGVRTSPHYINPPPRLRARNASSPARNQKKI